MINTYIRCCVRRILLYTITLMLRDLNGHYDDVHVFIELLSKVYSASAAILIVYRFVVFACVRESFSLNFIVFLCDSTLSNIFILYSYVTFVRFVLCLCVFDILTHIFNHRFCEFICVYSIYLTSYLVLITNRVYGQQVNVFVFQKHTNVKLYTCSLYISSFCAEFARVLNQVGLVFLTYILKKWKKP